MASIAPAPPEELQSTDDKGLSEAFEAFVSYDHGMDAVGRSMKERSARVCHILSDKFFLRLRYDDDVDMFMDEHALQKVRGSVDSSDFFCILLTQKYIERARGRGPAGVSDPVYVAFEHAMRSKRLQEGKVVLCFMEPGIEDPSSWGQGRIARLLGAVAQRRAFVFDLSDTPPNPANIEALSLKLGGTAVAQRRGAKIETVRQQLQPENQSERFEWFFFLDADKLRQHQWKDDEPLPRFQDLRSQAKYEGWLSAVEEESVTLLGACSGEYVQQGRLAVSHRWDTIALPDVPSQKNSVCEQRRAIVEHLHNEPLIKKVWYDYSCLPQKEMVDPKDYNKVEDKRSPQEKMWFRGMLPNMSRLYLGCNVLCIVDNNYSTRFWTNYEAWLSMRKASHKGLVSIANDEDKRCTIKCIMNASDEDRMKLIKRWSGASVVEVAEKLRENDILVTNMKDKADQLASALAIDQEVQDLLKKDADKKDADEIPTPLLDAEDLLEAHSKKFPPDDPQYHVFISAAPEDAEYAEKLQKWLVDCGLKTRFHGAKVSDFNVEHEMQDIEDTALLVILASSSYCNSVGDEKQSAVRTQFIHGCLMHGARNAVFVSIPGFGLSQHEGGRFYNELQAAGVTQHGFISFNAGDSLTKQLLLMKLSRHASLSRNAASAVENGQLQKYKSTATTVQIWEESQAAVDQAKAIYAPKISGSRLAAEGVAVVVRVRPFNDREKGKDCKLAVFLGDKDEKGEEIIVKSAREEKSYKFNRVLWSFKEGDKFKDGSPAWATQETVFQDIGEPVLQKAMDGFSCCLFAYGQTGAGKSYSVTGPDPVVPGQEGIVLRCAKQLFKLRDEQQGSNRQIHILCSMLEIYRENLHDLLDDNGKKKSLRLRDLPDGAIVEGVNHKQCETYDDLYAQLNAGFGRRTIAATMMNKTSSRAHTLFKIKIVRVDRVEGSGEAHTYTGEINLIDLAGSERASKTGAEGEQLKEAISINQSLTHLGTVIQTLADNASKKKGQKKHVPFSNSKLTLLLKNALSGNSMTVMIAAVSPADDNADETLSTLRYANNALKLKLNQRKMSTKNLIPELRKEIALLKAQLADRDMEIDKLKAGRASNAGLNRLPSIRALGGPAKAPGTDATTLAPIKRGFSLSKGLSSKTVDGRNSLSRGQSSTEMLASIDHITIDPNPHFNRESIEKSLQNAISKLNPQPREDKVKKVLENSAQRLENCTFLWEKDLLCKADIKEAIGYTFDVLNVQYPRFRYVQDRIEAIIDEMQTPDETSSSLRSIYGISFDEALIAVSSAASAAIAEDEHPSSDSMQMVQEVFRAASKYLHEVKTAYNGEDKSKQLYVAEVLDQELSTAFRELKFFEEDDEDDQLTSVIEGAKVDLQSDRVEAGDRGRSTNKGFFRAGQYYEKMRNQKDKKAFEELKNKSKDLEVQIEKLKEKEQQQGCCTIQ